MNLFRSTALLLFVATSATAQRDADNGFIKSLRQVHGEKSHGDHQHLSMDHSNNVKAPDLTDSPSKLKDRDALQLFMIFIENQKQFVEFMEKSFERLVVIEVTNYRWVY